MTNTHAKAASDRLVSLSRSLSSLIFLLLIFLSPQAHAQTVSLQGVWTGTRTATGSLGVMPATSTQTFTLYQTTPGGNVVGTMAIYWPGTSYYWSGSASGTISGSTMSLTFTPQLVNLPSGVSACGQTESLPISTGGGVTTMVMPSYHPCGDTTVTLLSYTLTLQGWQHLGCSPCGPGPQSGTPIDATTGNVTDTETDYTTSGANPLVFSRYYNSLNPPGTFAGTMGTQWRTNYDRYLNIVSSSQVIAERPGGDQITFNLVSGTWTPGSDVDMTLTNSGTTWTLTGHDDSVETYTASGTKGTLTSIALRNGYTQTLSYTSGLLTTVTDSYSRTLGLSYTGGKLTQVTTPDSLVLTYGYNTGGTLLTSVSYNTSPTTSQTYNYANSSFPSALTSITDENGNTWKTFSYDTYGRSTAAQMTGTSAATSMAYNDTTAARTGTNQVSLPTSYQLTMVGPNFYNRLVGMNRTGTGSVLGATSAFAYDTNGFTNSVTDFNGNVTTYTNNSHGDPTQIVEASGTSIARTTTIVYDTTWVHLPATITTPGVTATFTYDTHGNPLTVTLTDTTTQSIPYSTNGTTRTWTYTYDSTGHVLTAKTPNSNTTTFTYDSSGRLTQTTNALSQSVNVTSLTAGGQPLSVTDANGVTTTFTYNTRNWQLTRDVDSGGGAYTSTNTYDAAGNVTKAQAPDGSYFTNTYDNSHRLTKKSDSFGNSINYTLDALGNATATKIEDPSSAVTRSLAATFDALGRKLTYTGGASQITYYSYDSNNNLKQVIDPLNNTYAYTIDALNRVSKNTLPISGANIAYTFDAHDRPLTVTDALGHATSYVYDGFGDVIQRTSPDTGTVVYHYDSDGNLTSKTDALSVVTNYTYDALDRMLTTSYPAHTAENVSYTYDQTGTGFANGIGRLTSLTDAAGSLTRKYDTRGDLITETRTNGSTVLATTYSYDAAGRVLTITYPDNSLVTYTRDAMGKVTAVTDKPSGASSATTIASNITYKPFGPVSGFSYGNGLTNALTLDGDYRITTMVDNGTGSTHIQNVTYSLNAGDAPTHYLDNLNNTNSVSFIAYDGMNHINEFQAISGGGANFPTYDKNGNRTGYYSTTYTVNSGTSQLHTIVNGSATTTVTTNSNGNITAFSPAFGSVGVTGLSYNNANELASVSGSSGTLGSYAYDAFHQRFSKTVGTTTTMYQYSQGGPLFAETTGSTSETDYIYVNGHPIAMLTGSTFTWLHDDQLGTPQVATNSSQSVVWHGNYLPFGEPNGSGGTATVNLRMPGQYFDAESGFTHNGARDYVPSIGRYLEADPLGFYDYGLGEGSNSYNYAGQNPMHNIDPSGLQVPGTGNGSPATAGGGGWRHAPECTGGGNTPTHTWDWWITNFPADGTVWLVDTYKSYFNTPNPCTGGDETQVAGEKAAPQAPDSGDSCTCPSGLGYAPFFPEAGGISGVAEGLIAETSGDEFQIAVHGGIFENRECKLPIQPFGYYFIVDIPTPGASNRGAQRYVVGDMGEVYYTCDHYGTFQRLQ